MIRSRIIFIVLIAGLTISLDAQCRKASSKEVPHRGNDYNEISRVKVPNLKGTILLLNDEPVKEAVVEIYKYSGKLGTEEHSIIPYSQKRIRACKTGEDGKYELTGLPEGNYFLRAGSIDRYEFNPTHAVIIIDKKATMPEGNGLKIYLQLAH